MGPRIEEQPAAPQGDLLFGEHIWRTQYRPFVKQHCYVEYTLVNNKYQQDSIFPSEDCHNRAICVPGIGSTKPFSALMVDCMPDLHFVAFGQCFPRYRYARREQSDLLDDPAGVERVDNISDTHSTPSASATAIPKSPRRDLSLRLRRAARPDYRARFADDLAKSLPRIPFAPEFRAFAEAGRALPSFTSATQPGPNIPCSPRPPICRANPLGRLFGTRSMRLAGEGESVLIVNDRLRLSGIPPDAHRYEVNGRTPSRLVHRPLSRHEDKESGITNDPNAWFSDEAAFIAAVRRIVHLSVETVRIVQSLPDACSESEGQPAESAGEPRLDRTNRRCRRARDPGIQERHGTRREATRTVCATLNQQRGQIQFDVTPDGQVVGQQLAERIIETVRAEFRKIDLPARQSPRPHYATATAARSRPGCVLDVAHAQAASQKLHRQVRQRLGAAFRVSRFSEHNGSSRPTICGAE